MRIAVIGGGAAGFFTALSCARHYPTYEIILFEKGNALLSKVKVSGGGRCNVTNNISSIPQLLKNYPRGGKALRKTMEQFSTADTISWFEEHGVTLKTEPDGRMFPVTDDSQTIINCLVQQAIASGITIKTGMGVVSIKKNLTNFQIEFVNKEFLDFDKIIIATGGKPNDQSYQWLRDIGHQIIAPAPSLFTFNIPKSPLDGLQGLVVKDALIKIKNTSLQEKGIVLVTHWGFSGPAILRLSAWGARTLKEQNYEFSIHFNWLSDKKEEELRSELLQFKTDHPKKIVLSTALYQLPKRLWERLCALNGIEETWRWGELPNKNLNKLIEALLRDAYVVEGKTTFKEEFVTAGGVDLEEINMETMESLIMPGIFFAGEVVDIDGITGGFNFQAAWATGWVAGKHIGK